MTPIEFKPQTITDFVGPARKAIEIITKKVSTLMQSGSAFSIIFYGAPGTGKSELSRITANLMASHCTNIEHINGQSLSVDKVRDWERSSVYKPLGGGYTVKIVDEVDAASLAAMNQLRTYLDRKTPWTAFISSTNLDITQLQDQLQSRLKPFKISRPTSTELSEFIASRWNVPADVAMRISEGTACNVRSALIDTDTWLDLNN